MIPASPFGSVAIIWSAMGGRSAQSHHPKIVHVLLSKPGLSAEHRVERLYPRASISSCVEIDDIIVGIIGMLQGEAVMFSLDGVDLNLCGEFQQRVLRATHRIPRGRVDTYRLIAERLGIAGGARAVGNALANNPFPLIVPCHRVIRSDRTPGGYWGGLHMKTALLEREGICLDDGGRVQCAPGFMMNCYKG
ncbi:MAG: MGMT family protein [Gammaproteobacteria bacterium]|nr:MGMT family protein [Gammaproteobacteria bacterium]